MKSTLKRNLKREFINLEKELKGVKSCLEQTNSSLIKEKQEIIEKIRQEREQLYFLFSAPSYVNLCRNCHREYCCRNNYKAHLIDGELIYLAAIDYIFPQPNWAFLEKNIQSGQYYCLFFAPTGCLLKENRRLICFKYVCKDLYVILTKENQISLFEQLTKELKTATKILSRYYNEQIEK